MSARLAKLDQRRRTAAVTVAALLLARRRRDALLLALAGEGRRATDVVDALSALLGSIDRARRDLEDSDAGSAARGDQLTGRLG